MQSSSSVISFAKQLLLKAIFSYYFGRLLKEKSGKKQHRIKCHCSLSVYIYIYIYGIVLYIENKSEVDFFFHAIYIKKLENGKS